MAHITRDKSFYKQFFSLLLFIALQNLIVYCVNLADNIMLGRWSEEALSGVALANQVQFLLPEHYLCGEEVLWFYQLQVLLK